MVILQTVQTIARRAATLALTSALLAPTLGSTIPALAEEPIVRDHRHPTAHVQVILRRIIVHDDMDWGAGDIAVNYNMRVSSESCVRTRWDTCGESLVEGVIPEFHASDGASVVINRTIPGPGDTIAGPSTSPENGILIHDGQWFGLWVEAAERDAFEDDSMGILRTSITDEEGQVRYGTFTERGWGPCDKKPLVFDFCPPNARASFSVEYEIRPTPLPDLQPTAFRVANEAPGDRDDTVCFTVKNQGSQPAAPFRVSVGMVGESPLVPDIGAAALAAGETREQCTGARLPDSEQHRVMVTVDPADAIPEMDEKNNDLMVGLDRTPAGQTRAPGGLGNAQTDGTESASDGDASDGPIILIANPSPTPIGVTDEARATRPDLTVASIKVNGQVPDGKNDCKAGNGGQNAVVVVVKNAGPAAISTGPVTVRLAVDGDTAGELSVPAVEAGQEREARFEDVRLKKGPHKLAATVDPSGSIPESNEENNRRTVTAACQSAA
jgi:hypothetical protein